MLFAGLDIGWAGQYPGLGMGWTGHRLGWTSPGLGTACAVLDMGRASLGLDMSRLSIGRNGIAGHVLGGAWARPCMICAGAGMGCAGREMRRA
jgi:hypothetical protein